MLWDIIMVLCCLSLAVLIPLQLSFLDAASQTGAWIAIDLVLVLDVLVSFATTGIDPASGLFLSASQVARRYAKSWLIIDLVSALPTGFFGKPGRTAYTVSRILKLVKLPKYFLFVSSLERHLHYRALFWAKIYCPLITLMHLLACGWNRVRQSDGISVGEDNYAADLYWVVMSMTTVGYGDIVPTSVRSRIYASAVMVLSSLFSGTIVAVVTSAYKRHFDNEVDQHIKEASKFMRSRQVSMDVVKRVEYSLRRNMLQDRGLKAASKILSHLTPAIQRDLSSEFLRTTMHGFPLFRDLGDSSRVPQNMMAQLAQVHSWVEAMAGDLVIEEGQLEEALVFVMHGSLLRIAGTTTSSVHSEHSQKSVHFGSEASGSEVMSKEVSNTKVKQDILCKGAWFGERCFFKNDSMCGCTILADVDSELAVLAASDYIQVLKLYPDIWKRQQTLVKLVNDGRLDLQDLEYTSTGKGTPESFTPVVASFLF